MGLNIPVYLIERQGTEDREQGTRGDGEQSEERGLRMET
jgi:hypothetical protein